MGSSRYERNIMHSNVEALRTISDEYVKGEHLGNVVTQPSSMENFLGDITSRDILEEYVPE